MQPLSIMMLNHRKASRLKAVSGWLKEAGKNYSVLKYRVSPKHGACSGYREIRNWTFPPDLRSEGRLIEIRLEEERTN